MEGVYRTILRFCCELKERLNAELVCIFLYSS